MAGGMLRPLRQGHLILPSILLYTQEASAGVNSGVTAGVNSGVSGDVSGVAALRTRQHPLEAEIPFNYVDNGSYYDNDGIITDNSNNNNKNNNNNNSNNTDNNKLDMVHKRAIRDVSVCNESGFQRVFVKPPLDMPTHQLAVV